LIDKLLIEFVVKTELIEFDAFFSEPIASGHFATGVVRDDRSLAKPWTEAL
jgi:hypothetical protein